MDWFLYDIGLLHERVKFLIFITFKAKQTLLSLAQFQFVFDGFLITELYVCVRVE